MQAGRLPQQGAVLEAAGAQAEETGEFAPYVVDDVSADRADCAGAAVVWIRARWAASVTVMTFSVLARAASWDTMRPTARSRSATYASRGTRVRPGDIIGSGTVGTGCILELGLTHGEAAFPWLRPGDEVTLEIEQLGAIRSLIKSSTAPVSLR
ncbi:fumarylacetoacetate hydrolase family protein [Streptomyces sp. LaPpAH-108]|uniref:fumarylacetoacetate hydrolase family protein n=1 Tax=Streptomyces sp. LaPpAH-108 TaxID=1155714 RepID=UPI00037BA99C|nr:fumarylacetoacetate hydrolase family protein [Streptomyces sp. LaPpAH-108]